MKIEKIESNRIKITLYTEDLQMFNLTKNHLKNDTPELHMFLYEIMKKVQNETGFDPYDGQVLVEAIGFERGLILLVSKSENKKPTLKKVRSVKAVKKSECPKKKEAYVCRFEKFSDLCRMFEECGNVIENGAQLFKNADVHYLILNNTPNCCISEYAEVYGTDALNVEHIKEHSVHIAEGESLLKMAEFMSDVK